MATYQHYESLTTSGGAMPVFISTPEGREPRPTVLVIQGMHGVEAFELSVAERLAEHGFVGVVPDLFHRGPACFSRSDLDNRRRAMADPQRISDLTLTISYLKTQPYVDAHHLGIIGFCMGGRMSYLMAGTSPEIKVAACFYGGGILLGEQGPSPLELTPNIRCPVALFDGEEDTHPSPDEVRGIGAELARHGIPHEVHIYPGVGHGYMGAQGAGRRQDVIDESWTSLIAWIERYLVGELAAAPR